MRLTTTRLILRRLRDDDLDALCALNADPEVMRFILMGPTPGREQTLGRYRAMAAHWDEHGFGLFAVERRDDGELAGWAGPGHADVPARGHARGGDRLEAEPAELGPGHRHRGGPGGRALAFDDIGLDRLLSIRHVDHVASGRVMEKLGFAFERTTTVPVHEQPVSVWELDASGYRAGAVR